MTISAMYHPPSFCHPKNQKASLQVHMGQQMILPKKERGLWVINTKPINLLIKRAANFWEKSPSILSISIQKRYNQWGDPL